MRYSKGRGRKGMKRRSPLRGRRKKGSSRRRRIPSYGVSRGGIRL